MRCLTLILLLQLASGAAFGQLLSPEQQQLFEQINAGAATGLNAAGPGMVPPVLPPGGVDAQARALEGLLTFDRVNRARVTLGEITEAQRESGYVQFTYSLAVNDREQILRTVAAAQAALDDKVTEAVRKSGYAAPSTRRGLDAWTDWYVKVYVPFERRQAAAGLTR